MEGKAVSMLRLVGYAESFCGELPAMIVDADRSDNSETNEDEGFKCLVSIG